MDMNAINDLVAKAVEAEDQSVEVTSNFTDDPIEAGLTVGRLIEYIELGKHKQPDFQGKAKPDAEMVRLTFELLHPTKNMREYEVDGVKHNHGQMISVTMTKKLSEKAKFKKLFNKMTYGRPITHFAQMLTEAFVINIYHNVVKKDGKDVTYVNIDKDGDFGIGAPYSVDPMTGQKNTYQVGTATRPVRLFLWDNPTKETWDSLFIDGTRERKNEDGSVEQVSKNWLQQRILSASNYGGSELHNMLGGVDDLPMTEVDPITGLPVSGPAPTDDGLPFDPGNETDTRTSADLPATQPQQPASEQQPVTAGEVAPKQNAAPAAADDALAALGLLPA